MKKSGKILILILILISSCQEKRESNDYEYKVLVKKIRKSAKDNKYSLTKLYLKKYLEKALKENNTLFTGKAYHRLGIYYENFNETDSAYYFYRKANTYFERINDSIRLGKNLSNISIIESSYGDFTSSNYNSVKALRLFNNKDKEYMANIYNCLAINYEMQFFFETAITNYKKAINFSQVSKKVLEYKNNMANSYKEARRYNESIEVLKKLLKDSLLNKNLKTKARVIDNLAYTKWLQDSTRNVVSDLHLAESIRIAEKDRNGLIASYSHLADYYKNLNINKSLEYAYKMKNVAENEKSVYDIIEALDKVKVLEKPERAIVLANRRSIIKDSIELAKDNAQEKYALIKYESEENEKKAIENKFLAEQQKSQKQLLGFAVILTVLSSLVYFFYKREKTKKEKAIEVYNTETRLSKKIHDELANDVYAVMNTLQNKAETDTKLLARVEKIYAQTRDISHENSPVLTGEHFESFLKQLFIDFTNDACKVIHKGLKEVIVNELPKEKQIVLYRVLRELLVNMKKHSEASLVLITFSLSKKMLFVVYQDNGKGVKSLSIKSGLQNMETRIKSVGGIITFESKQEKGFQAKFHFKK
ncbi:hypothetical protein VBY74_09690 [Tenacibaculum ascidiaceicola]|uniref:tetratricopeptide repeat-containing sensor histidine kinase n=1 Tax=Tenacibaculum ascidiaceicola TaxID=1699411 RepID=UPI0039ED626B